MRTVGTVVRGVRAPIIRENDDLVAIVADSVCAASQEEGFQFRDRDVVAVTESVVARAYGTYASTDDIADDSLSIAGGYRDIVFAGGETYLNLTAAQCEAVVDALAEKGYAAFDYTRSLAVRNPGLVTGFIDAVNAGDDAGLTLLEVTQDGGFLRRDIIISGGERTLVSTRLTWRQGEAIISAQGVFRLTDIYLNGKTLCFDFEFPDNPEGGNHDGHVETYTEIKLEP